MKIDLEGISSCMLAFPVQEALNGQIQGIENGRVIYSRCPVEGTLHQPWMLSIVSNF